MNVRSVFSRINSVMHVLFIMVMVLAVAVGGLYWFGIFLYGIPDSEMGPIRVFPWADQNGNGKYEAEERPWSAGCIWTATSALDYNDPNVNCRSEENLTDSSGNWYTFPSQGIYVFAALPAGFQYSTPAIAKATRNFVEFGPAPAKISVSSRIASIGTYADSLPWKETERTAISYIILGLTSIFIFYESWRAYIKMKGEKK